MLNPRKNGRFFEDFQMGETLIHATPRTVTEGDAALYIALTGARQVLHCAQPVAHAMGFRQQTIDDLLGFHIAFGKTVPDISVNAVANLGYAEVKFVHPVYPGDTLHTHSTVIGLKENANHKTGIVYVRSIAQNQNQQTVYSWVRWVMVRKRDEAAPAPMSKIPELDAVVGADDLPIFHNLDARHFDTQVTGSDQLWEDYSVGAVIHHPSGMTIEDSDHMLATRLYQNNARLHFDALMMQDTHFGKRLMYGGHVISICRALSYDGLENALSIAAINSGTHCNPTFGGDTLYCQHHVLDKWALHGRTDLGALRLRMLGIKNLPSEALESVMVEQAGQTVRHPHIVLDLDYTVLMPRRSITR